MKELESEDERVGAAQEDLPGQFRISLPLVENLHPCW